MSSENNRLEEFLSVDCDVLPIIGFGDIAALNFRIVEPERFSNIQGQGEVGEFKKFISKTVEKSNLSPEFSTGHENDRFNTSNEGTLQNLLEFEFHYKCQENNDLIYLASVLMHRIVEGHPFEEGNKRTAYAATCLFLMSYEISELGGDHVVIPTLDEALLNELESIAENKDDIGPENIEKLIRPGFKEEVKKIL